MELESLWYGVILWYIFGFMILTWYYAISTCICNINMILWYLQKTVQVCSLNFEMHFRISSLWLTLLGGTLEQGFARDWDCGNSLFAYIGGLPRIGCLSGAANTAYHQQRRHWATNKKTKRQKDGKTKRQSQLSNAQWASLPIRAWY